MTYGIKRETTPAEVAKFGHIATLLRDFLDRKDWKPADVNRALGYEGTSAAVYNWLNARGAPSPKAREQLAELLGVQEIDLMARTLESEAPPMATDSPSPSAPEKRTKDAKPPPPSHPRDVLSFTINATGATRIRLDVELPQAAGLALLRTLLEAGLVMAPAEPDAGPTPDDIE